MTLPHIEQRKHVFLVKIKIKAKSNKLAPRKKVSLELLHQILGHRYTRSLMAGDTENVWQNIEHRINPDPFCTSCHISTMNKKARSKTPLRLSHFSNGFYGHYSRNVPKRFDK